MLTLIASTSSEWPHRSPDYLWTIRHVVDRLNSVSYCVSLNRRLAVNDVMKILKSKYRIEWVIWWVSWSESNAAKLDNKTCDFGRFPGKSKLAESTQDEPSSINEMREILRCHLVGHDHDHWSQRPWPQDVWFGCLAEWRVGQWMTFRNYGKIAMLGSLIMAHDCRWAH